MRLDSKGATLDARCDCYCLRQATRRVTQLYDRALAPLGLRSTQYTLLSEIERLGPISLLPLAEAMVMDRATLGHNIRPLEARGLITVEIGQDRRSREVSLTRPGKDLLTKGARLWRRAQQNFEQVIGREEAAQLRADLQRVALADFRES